VQRPHPKVHPLEIHTKRFALASLDGLAILESRQFALNLSYLVLQTPALMVDKDCGNHCVRSARHCRKIEDLDRAIRCMQKALVDNFGADFVDKVYQSGFIIAAHNAVDAFGLRASASTRAAGRMLIVVAQHDIELEDVSGGFVIELVTQCDLSVVDGAHVPPLDLYGDESPEILKDYVAVTSMVQGLADKMVHNMDDVAHVGQCHVFPLAGHDAEHVGDDILSLVQE